MLYEIILQFCFSGGPSSHILHTHQLSFLSFTLKSVYENVFLHLKEKRSTQSPVEGFCMEQVKVSKYIPVGTPKRIILQNLAVLILIPHCMNM